MCVFMKIYLQSGSGSTLFTSVQHLSICALKMFLCLFIYLLSERKGYACQGPHMEVSLIFPLLPYGFQELTLGHVLMIELLYAEPFC